MEDTQAPSEDLDPGRAAGGFAGLAAYSLATSVAIQLLNIASGVILARLLGPAGRGVLSAVILWPAVVVALGSLGIADATTYNVVRAPAARRSFSTNALLLAVGISAVLLTIGWLLSPTLLARFGPSALSSGRVYLAWIPLTLLTVATAASLRGALHIIEFNAVRFTVIALTVAGLVAVVAVRAGSIRNVVIVYLVANGITFAVSLFMARRARLLWAPPSFKRCWSILSFGLRAHAGTIWAAANARADQAVVALTLTSSDLGLYAVAITLTAGTALVGSSLAVITLPAVAGAPSHEESLRVFARCVRTCLALSVLVAGLVYVLTPSLIGLFFGPAFRNSVDAARILLVASIAMSLQPVLGSGLRGLGRPFTASVGDGLAAIAAISLLLILVPRLGIQGAAIAVATSYTTTCLWMVGVARWLGLPFRDLLVVQASDRVWLRSTIAKRLQRPTRSNV